MMNNDKLYSISVLKEEKFKREVAKLGVDGLKELKSYFDRVMPAKKSKGANLKIRLANYKHLTAYMADEQTIKRMRLEEQKREQEKSSMKHVIAKYRTAQKVPVRIMLTTRENFHIMLGSSMPWREMKMIHDRGYIGDCYLSVCGEILSLGNYKELSRFDLGLGKSLLIRNSQIIGMLVDEEKMMKNINGFVSELLEVADKYDLSDHKIDNYLDLENE